MKIGGFEIVRSKAVPFSWHWHRLTLKHNPPIYHWLWFTYGLHERPTTGAVDLGDSSALEVDSTPEVLSAGQGESHPAPNH